MQRRDEILAEIESSWPYVVCDLITIIMDEMKRAAYLDVCKILKASFGSELVANFIVRFKNIFDLSARGRSGMR